MIWDVDSRSRQGCEQVTESLAFFRTEQTTEGPHEAVYVESLNMKVTSQLTVVSQHGRKKVEASFEQTDLGLRQFQTEKKKRDNKLITMQIS